jgi:hypothetical protein
MLSVLLFSVFVYTFVHEAGHSLVGLLFRGELVSFNVNFFNLSAHAGIEGNFSNLQSAVISAAGVSFPLLVWGVWICLVPKKTNSLMQVFRLVFSMGVINALLAWIVIPIVVLNGGTASDDSINFLNKTQLNPLIVSGAALVIYLGGWALFLNRLGGAKAIWTGLREWHLESFATIRRTFIWMLAIASMMLAVVGVLSFTLENPEYHKAPSDYHTVALLDLSQKSYQNEVVYFFSLSKPSEVSLYFALKDIQSGPVRIDLAGSNGYRETFLQADSSDFNAVKASVNPTALLLQPGEYQVLLTFPQTGGSVTISILVESD